VVEAIPVTADPCTGGPYAQVWLVKRLTYEPARARARLAASRHLATFRFEARAAEIEGGTAPVAEPNI
jgi:hypothetical protein